MEWTIYPVLTNRNMLKPMVTMDMGACLDVETDSNTGKILTIQSGEILPLNACSTDPDLPQR